MAAATRRALSAASRVGGAARGFSAAAPASRPTEKLVIFDTTLRDGEQSPGATLTEPEKVEIAKQLSRLGVDVCEAGFPIASQGDFEAVSTVAKTAGHMVDGRPHGRPMRIAGLARAAKKDLERCYEAVRHAPLHRIHTFLASSDIHLEHKLGISRAKCIEISCVAGHGGPGRRKGGGRAEGWVGVGCAARQTSAARRGRGPSLAAAAGQTREAQGSGKGVADSRHVPIPWPLFTPPGQSSLPPFPSAARPWSPSQSRWSRTSSSPQRTLAGPAMPASPHFSVSES